MSTFYLSCFLCIIGKHISIGCTHVYFCIFIILILFFSWNFFQHKTWRNWSEWAWPILGIRILLWKTEVAYQGKVWHQVSLTKSEIVVAMEPLLGFDQAVRNDNEGSHGYKLVPWLNWEEWNSVRQSLFSSSPDSVGFALGRVYSHFNCLLILFFLLRQWRKKHCRIWT